MNTVSAYFDALPASVATDAIEALELAGGVLVRMEALAEDLEPLLDRLSVPEGVSDEDRATITATNGVDALWAILGGIGAAAERILGGSGDPITLGEAAEAISLAKSGLAEVASRDALRLVPEADGDA